MGLPEDRKFDIRTIDRNIQRGLVNHQDHEAYLASLKDVSAKAVPLEAVFVEGVLDKKRLAVAAALAARRAEAHDEEE